MTFTPLLPFSRPQRAVFELLSVEQAKAGRIDECYEVAKMMKALGIPVSTMTMNILIDACSKTGETRRANQAILHFRRYPGVALGILIYTP
jgi:hypothetical protein